MTTQIERKVTQHWDPDTYANKVRFISLLGAPLIEMLKPRPGERILDLGCGDGDLTERLAETGAVIVGIDSSAEFVAAARERGIDAYVGDAQEMTFAAEFDGVLSNAALHWMLQPDAVIDGVWRALKPGGRFVAEMGGHTNVAAVRAALYPRFAALGMDPATYDPWYFPSAESYRARLEARGFTIDQIELFPRPTLVEHGFEPWARTFLQSWLAAVPDDKREGFLNDVIDGLRPMLCDERGVWTVDYARLRFSAHRPA